MEHPRPLRPLLADAERRVELESQVENLLRVDLDARTAADVELLGNGAYTPLEGFLTGDDHRSVLERMRLANGTVWPLPVTLAVPRRTADAVEEGEQVALWHQSRPVAVMLVQEKYASDPEEEARAVYGTDSTAHPGVSVLLRRPEVLLGGPVEVLVRDLDTAFGRFRLTPAQLRDAFARRGWKRIVGFQTRNPIHRVHEHITKAALEQVDGLLLHPVVGETQAGDVPADVRMRCYERLLEKYFPQDRTLLAAFPAAMRYAGPREAVFHAIVRRNYGCTHFIVGRDHAGVGGFYGRYDAQRVFSEFRPEELGVEPVFFEETFYCRGCGRIVAESECPHDPEQRVSPSGRRLRELLRRGESLPPEYTRPEVSRVLLEAYHPELRVEREARERSARPARRRVVVIGLSGLSSDLVLGSLRDRLPNLARIADRGVSGSLESTWPPLSLPAWPAMFTSRDPGQLGVYGRRARSARDYSAARPVTSAAIRAPWVWDLVAAAGRRAAVVGVPGTHPAPPGSGPADRLVLVTDRASPGDGVEWARPRNLAAEVGELIGGRPLALEAEGEGAPEEASEELLRRIYDVTDRRFQLARHFAASRDPDLLVLVETGPDRLHRVFWRHGSATHPRHRPDNPFRDVVNEYYVYLDHAVGELLKALPEDATVIVASDHGVQDARGAVCLNEWLLDRGWLALSEPRPERPVPLSRLAVDWSRTRAWADGGACGRIHLNVRGREPSGTVEPAETARALRELGSELTRLAGLDGRPLGVRAVAPQEAYAAANGVPPELVVGFGDLAYGVTDTVGHSGSHVVEGRERGAPDAQPEPRGVFLFAGPGAPGAGLELEGLRVQDVAPTVLRLFGLDIPPEMLGRAIAQ